MTIETRQANQADQTVQQDGEKEFPPAQRSLEAARRLIGPEPKGVLKIIRRYVGPGIALWRVEATLRKNSGPDYELEVEGNSLDEVAFSLVDALEQVGFTA